MANSPSFGRTRSRAEVLNAFMRGVYTWMCAGLGVTTVAAFYTASSQAMLQFIFGNTFVLIGLVIAQLGIVVGLSGAVKRLSPGAATGLFMLYSALTGVTLSAVLVAYSGAAVFKAFLTTAGMFGAMSIYGWTTKRDLTGWGSFLFMGLIGIIIASVVNIFMASPMLDFVISGVGVLIFTGLTAYDTQQLKAMGETAPDDAGAVRKATILGALRLYLDFINLFLMLLRFFGGRE